jgi:hypothetical protein
MVLGFKFFISDCELQISDFGLQVSLAAAFGGANCERRVAAVRVHEI